eukprot:5509187-Pyramimonas_sp.AAC.1
MRFDSRLPRRDGDYRQLDLLSSQLARIFCDRSLCLRRWTYPQRADVPTDFGGNIVRRWPHGPPQLASAKYVTMSSILLCRNGNQGAGR